MVDIITSALLSDAGFEDHGFTLRTGGHSKGPFKSLNLAFNVDDDPKMVSKNLSALKDFTGAHNPLLRVNQVHGRNVITAETMLKNNEGDWIAAPQMEADAIIATPNAMNVVLAIQTADCAPVLLADTTTGLTAAIHAGWRSTAKGIVRNTVKKMLHMGAQLPTMVAAIGPCICLKCYEVDEDVARNFPESSDPIRKKEGKFLLDLGLAVEVSLIGAGLSTKGIDRIEECTRCNPDRYFSYRGTNGKCGRQLAFIGPKKDI